WLGGMLTNFRTIRSRLQRLEQLEAMEANGSLEAESKKQASRLKREMRKIAANLNGVRKMSSLPGAVVVVDARKEYLALAEAKKLGISTIGIIDTNSNPDTVNVAIPANDDSIRAIDLILNELADAVAIGKTMTSARIEPRARVRRVRSRRTPMGQANREEAAAAKAVKEEAVKAGKAAPAKGQKAEQEASASEKVQEQTPKAAENDTKLSEQSKE
ncbi:MAG: 30S ribosomal protein S2, partial [Planctomycetota bacterium]